MKRILDKKFIFGTIFGLIIAGIVGVVASSIYLAGDVGYTPNDNAWKVDTIEEAINELYNQDYSVRNSCKEQVAVPNLGSDGKLIPVTLEDDGTVIYADTSKEWYNYCDAYWANAVILIDEPSKTYSVGEKIDEADIESYFVWIPKYKYKLWNTGNGTAINNIHSIEIVFDTKNTFDEEGVSCATPMTSGNIGNCNNGEYMTHPAFISMDVDGFWVGKFETGYKDATSTSEAQKAELDKNKIVIKPNVYSWRGNTVYNFFVSSYEYEKSLNSHMMKNTEWGAVAYLSHSKYGINQEVIINNNSDFITGFVAIPGTFQLTTPGVYGVGETYNKKYNEKTSFMGSTTGNITGIYDMNGGSHEYMASYMSGKFGNSGFTTTTIANYDAKYFDIYSNSSTLTGYAYKILGDATGEMGSFKNYSENGSVSRYHNNWYADYSTMLESENPWFDRSGGMADGVLAGPFYFFGYTGAAFNHFGSRLVLAP